MSNETSEQNCGWIRIRGLRVEGARVGVYPDEHDSPRPIIVDIGVVTNVATAAHSENLADTIDYDTLAQAVHKVCRSRHYNLIETLCERLAAFIIEAFGVEQVAVEIHKPAATGGATASVAIERSITKPLSR